MPLRIDFARSSQNELLNVGEPIGSCLWLSQLLGRLVGVFACCDHQCGCYLDPHDQGHPASLDWRHGGEALSDLIEVALREGSNQELGDVAAPLLGRWAIGSLCR